MTYHIKSTPYYQRMLNLSKKNGQLQRLRDEYERIQDFNDRTIEKKMRQVRLKRLFREIEEIKETRNTTTKLNNTPIPLTIGPRGAAAAAATEATVTTLTTTTTKTMGATSTIGSGQLKRRRSQGGALIYATQDKLLRATRLETLARAKELGKELSRRNAEAVTQNGRGGLRSSKRLSHKNIVATEAKRKAVECRERAAKRKNYGNTQSKCNQDKIVKHKARKQSRADLSIDGSVLVATEFDERQLKKHKMLQQRLQYGNAISQSNMKRTARQRPNRLPIEETSTTGSGSGSGSMDGLYGLAESITSETDASSEILESSYENVLDDLQAAASASLKSRRQQREACDPRTLCQTENINLNSSTLFDSWIPETIKKTDQKHTTSSSIIKQQQLQTREETQMRWHRAFRQLSVIKSFLNNKSTHALLKPSEGELQVFQEATDDHNLSRSTSYETINSSTLPENADSYKEVWHSEDSQEKENRLADIAEVDKIQDDNL